MKTLVNLAKIDARRAGAIALAFGVVGLGLDAAIAHFAGREMKNPAQLIPVIAACLLTAIVPFALKAVRAGLLSTVLRIAGGLSVVVGALGTAFHVSAFMRLLEGQEVTWKAIELALAVAPPLAAPGAFIAVGGLFLLLASPRLLALLVEKPLQGAADAAAL